MRDRLAAETTEERDARFECDRARHRETTDCSVVTAPFSALFQVKIHTNMPPLDMRNTVVLASSCALTQGNEGGG